MEVAEDYRSVHTVYFAGPLLHTDIEMVVEVVQVYSVHTAWIVGRLLHTDIAGAEVAVLACDDDGSVEQ